MTEEFKFRSGRYAGKTYSEVSEKNPSYIDWILANRPEMLKEYKRKVPNTVGLSPREKFNQLMNNNSMKPNHDFDNEK
jgi:hypothetical protein